MKQADVVQSFIDGCETSQPSPQRVAQIFPPALEALGFRYFAYCSHVDPLRPPPEAVMMHNYPAVWERHFSEARLYESDPVLLRAERDPMPFFWDATFRAEPVTKPQKRVLTEAARLGLAHGFTVPLQLSWLPGSLRASCSVVPDSSRIDPHNFQLVDALANYLFMLLYRARTPAYTVAPCYLTKRERECLTLAARGFNDWEIGEALKLSETTVHTHIASARRRLGAPTRMSALMQALVRGAIAYGDVICRCSIGAVKPRR